MVRANQDDAHNVQNLRSTQRPFEQARIPFCAIGEGVIRETTRIITASSATGIPPVVGLISLKMLVTKLMKLVRNWQPIRANQR